MAITPPQRQRRPGEGSNDRFIPAADRLMSRVHIKPDGCWEWTAFVTPQGYGACGYRGKRNTLAHRAVYTELVGPVADDLTLDHLCHTRDKSCPGGKTCPHRRCVNPAHLEPVPSAVNVSRGAFARRTHCPKGHPYEGENLSLTKNGGRFCVTCSRDRARERHALLMAERVPTPRKPRTRPTHCVNGHPFDEANTYVRRNGRHACRECVRSRQRRHREPPRTSSDANGVAT